MALQGKKALIIGICGFAGSALRKELTASGYDVYGVDIFSTDDRVIPADMLDKHTCETVISEMIPDIIFNLAGQASPIISWKDIDLTMKLNVNLSVNVAEAVRKFCPETRMVFIGSANQYDLRVWKDELITEDTPVSDDSPYSVSKNTQEALLKLLKDRYGLDMVFTRSFNHIGPGQKPGFVITDYAKRIADLETGRIETFEYGNLDSCRDFSDVRDVARAYRLLGEQGKSGRIYNVGSGKSFYIRDLVGHLISLSKDAAEKTTLPPKAPEGSLIPYRADISSLKEDTGFEPQYDVYETIESVLEAYRSNYA
ncbi:MAG: GDP-mannose 4,6-dehydratase [Clostridiales bacterium]|nr:GDP-mannose 4,6-dehydratase [Clostridiales bacterium]